jgi:hypothetical protein
VRVWVWRVLTWVWLGSCACVQVEAAAAGERRTACTRSSGTSVPARWSRCPGSGTRSTTSRRDTSSRCAPQFERPLLPPSGPRFERPLPRGFCCVFGDHGGRCFSGAPGEFRFWRANSAGFAPFPLVLGPGCSNFGGSLA